MTLDKSIISANEVQSLLEINSNYQNIIQSNINQIMEPIRNMQSQLAFINAGEVIAQSLAPFVDIRNQIIATLSPLQNFQDQVSQMYEPLYSMLEDYNNMRSIFNSAIADMVQKQRSILQNLSSVDLDISSTKISYESSMDFAEITLNTLSEIDSIDSTINISESKDIVASSISVKESLTLDQIMSIIAIIISIITFIQSQIPNKQLLNIENSLEQLIEIQTKELNLLEKSFE